MHFTNLLIIMVVALIAPLVVSALPALRVPSPVLEIVAGAALLLTAGGFASTPLLIAIILCAASLGLVVPVLKDSGQVAGATGQLVIAAASIADFGAVILLSLFFSEESTGLAARLLLLAGLALVVVLLAVALMRAGRTARADRVFQMLMDTTAQIRIRFAMVLLLAFVALAQGLGFEAILGAFLAGAVLRLIDADAATVHPHTELKLDAIGYGFLIPVFFITSGVMFDAKALFASPSTLLQVPLFLAALFMVRGFPALLYRAELGMRRAMAAGFLQAPSLPFIVAAVQVGQRLGALPPASGAALIAAGLASVLLFPAIALAVIRSAPSEDHVSVPPLLGRRSQ